MGPITFKICDVKKTSKQLILCNETTMRPTTYKTINDSMPMEFPKNFHQG